MELDSCILPKYADRWVACYLTTVYQLCRLFSIKWRELMIAFCETDRNGDEAVNRYLYAPAPMFICLHLGESRNYSW